MTIDELTAVLRDELRPTGRLLVSGAVTPSEGNEGAALTPYRLATLVHLGAASWNAGMMIDHAGEPAKESR